MTYTLIIDRERCKGCGLCVNFCPKTVLEISNDLNKKGYYPAFQARPEDCIHCGTCYLMCPDVAISILPETPETKEDK